MRPLIWWGVRFWNKNENTWGAGPYHSKSSVLGWYPAACAALPTSAQRCTPSGHVWRVISRRTTERNRAIKQSLVLATLGRGTEPDYDR